MRLHSRSTLILSGIASAAILLSGCSIQGTTPADDGVTTVVASTNVYGDIATRIGGDLVDVTSIIDDPAQDPHSFEAGARIQLALSRADIVIENGGGYDDWAATLLDGAGNPGAVVINAVDASGYETAPATGEFNEHVWYDFPTVKTVVARLVAALSEVDAASASTFRKNADAVIADLDALIDREATLKASFDGTDVAITEPVPLYMLEAVGLTNVTPAGFTAAIENGTDVSPAVLAKTLALFTSGGVRLLVYNDQTTGAQTAQVLAAATDAGAAVVPVTEILPAGTDYLGWMTANLDALEAALETARGAARG